jgi:molybdopterin-guanine dinucleotide biosynthesis protein B
MIIGIYGYQDSGKTRLVEQVVPILSRKGYRLASIKHTSGGDSVDKAGKDTWRHWHAGSDPVVFESSSETAIMIHSGIGPERIVQLIRKEFNPDIIIIEGYKKGAFPKVALGRIKPLPGTVLRNPSAKSLAAYIEREVALERARGKLPGLDCGKCGTDCDGLAKDIAAGKRKLTDCRELPVKDVRITVDGRTIPVGTFVSDMVDKTVRGMLSSLKGYVPGSDVEIRLVGKKEKPRKGTRMR